MKRFLCLALSLLSLGGLAQQPTGSVYKVIPPKTGGITIVFPGGTSSPGSGTGPVSSVNNQTGAVVLTRSNLTGTQPASTITGLAPIATSGNWLDLGGKPAFSNVATSGSWLDLLNKPVLFSGAWGDLSGKPAFSTVATSGSWNDLLNRPSLFSGAWVDVTGKPVFSAVATSGSYADLLNKPVLFSGAWNDITGKPLFFSGAYGDLTGKPVLSTVATSGNWSDVLGKPVTFAPSAHLHDASDVSTGIFAPGRLGSGTAGSGKYLDGTGVWRDLSGAVSINQWFDNTLTGTPSDSVNGLGIDLAAELARIRAQFVNNLTTTTAGSALDGRMGKVIADSLKAQRDRIAANTLSLATTQPKITGTTDLTVASVTTTTLADADSSRKLASTDWVRRYVLRTMPTFIDFPYRSSQFTFSDSLSIRPDYIRSLFSGSGYNPATGVITSSTATGGSSGPWSTTGSIAYYNVTSGKVGIGTANPYKTLQVVGNVQATGFNLTDVDNGATDQRSIDLVSGAGIRVGGNAIFDYGGIYSQGNINYKADGNILLRSNSTDSRAMFFSPTGIAVGNGTNNATALFDVNGTLRAGGNVTLGASLSVTGNATVASSVTVAGNVKANTLTLSDGLPITNFASGDGINYGGNGTFHLRNSSVVDLIKSTLRGFDGFDENATNQVLTHVGQVYKWTTMATSTTGTSSTTSTGTASTASYRDSVLINADSTKMRFAVSGTTSVTLSTAAQIRSFLTSTQTNVRAFVANGIYDDGSPWEQNGTWTNVSLEALNYRQAIFQNSATSNGNLVWIHQGSAQRRRVRFKDFVIRTNATGSAENTNLPMYLHNELPDWDGLEWDGLEIYNMNPTVAKTNGFTFALYSEGKTGTQDKVLKNFFMHNCSIHDIPRANEFLSHGFDMDRGLNFVVTNNKFARHGTNDAYGVPLSFSGRIKYIYTAKNTINEFRRMAIEHVCNRFAITASNVISSTATNGGVGLAISDNNHVLTENIWFENNNVNVMDRPFYAYDVRRLTMTGGTYLGRNGADGSPINSTFKDFNLTVWSRPGNADYVWNFDGTSGNGYGNTVSNITASSGGTQANSPGGPAAYTIHLTSGTANNTFNNVTTILGKNASGNWGGTGAIINDGAASNIITNNTVSRVD